MMGPKKKVMKVSTKTMTQSRGLKTRTAKKAVREPSPSPPSSPASSMALDEELAQASQRGPTPPSEPVQEPVQEPDLQADIPDLRQGEKRKQEKPIILSEDHEADMADWLKGHPEFYTKGSREFKDSQKKKRLWELKATELGYTYDQLYKWYTSTRTRVGKLLQTVSGQEVDRSKTDRDKFLVKTFTFLKSHIVRQPARVARSVSIWL